MFAFLCNCVDHSMRWFVGGVAVGVLFICAAHMVRRYVWRWVFFYRAWHMCITTLSLIISGVCVAEGNGLLNNYVARNGMVNRRQGAKS